MSVDIKDYQQGDNCAICGLSTHAVPSIRVRPWHLNRVKKYGLKVGQLAHLVCIGTKEGEDFGNCAFVEGNERHSLRRALKYTAAERKELR